MNRCFPPFIARLMLVVLLFVQLAMAAYACPLDSARMSDSDSPPVAAQPVELCDRMAMSSPAMCFEHCVQRDQNSSHAEPLVVPPAMLAGFITVPEPATTVLASLSTLSIKAAPFVPPPHTVLHCSFRI